MTSELSLDRLEFHEIKIKANPKAISVLENHLPQLRIDFNKYDLYHRSKIAFPDSEVENPRHFAVTYGVKLESKPGETMPYDIEVEAMALLNYQGEDHAGADRFRAVRFSAYQMLHGAIREMVANLTARSRHGLLQIPSRNFNRIAKHEADEDEAERLAHISRLKEGTKADLISTGSPQKRQRSVVDTSAPTKKVSASKRKPSA